MGLHTGQCLTPKTFTTLIIPNKVINSVNKLAKYELHPYQILFRYNHGIIPQTGIGIQLVTISITGMDDDASTTDIDDKNIAEKCTI